MVQPGLWKRPAFPFDVICFTESDSEENIGLLQEEKEETSPSDSQASDTASQYSEGIFLIQTERNDFLAFDFISLCFCIF